MPLATTTRRCAVSNVGQAKVTDEAAGLQLLKVEQRFEPARIGIVPGVVLQEVDRLDAEARERALHGRADLGLRDPSRLRDPFREELHALLRRSRPEEARDHLGRPVVIGHVESREPGVDVGPHRRRRAIEIERPPVALHVGELPEPGEDARDGQIGRQVDVVQRVVSSERHSGGSAAKRARRSTPARRSRLTSRQ